MARDLIEEESFEQPKEIKAETQKEMVIITTEELILNNLNALMASINKLDSKINSIELKLSKLIA
jgi:hypothetical protein